MRPTRPQHVWVDLTNTWGERACPGLLIGWRQRNFSGRTRWEGWVIYAQQDAAAHGGTVRVSMDWVDGLLIRQAPGERPAADTSRYHPVNHDRLR